MLHPTRLLDLLVDPALHPRGAPHLSAASGLVQAGRFLYLVADDEHHLGVLPAGEPARVELHRTLPGDLPLDAAERKRSKADLEALAALPPTPHWPHGALVALGSGSTPARERAIVLPLRADGGLAGTSAILDLSGLYRPLRRRFIDLNIEGAFAAGGYFHLLQRANRGSPVNACVAYGLDAFMEWAADECAPPLPSRWATFDLGQALGIPLGFTDAAPDAGGGWIFSAVAEDTDHSYDDGRCAASAIGWVSADGVLQRLEPIAGAPKVEGIALVAPGRLLMATDADDPAAPSRLLELRLP